MVHVIVPPFVSSGLLFSALSGGGDSGGSTGEGGGGGEAGIGEGGGGDEGGPDGGYEGGYVGGTIATNFFKASMSIRAASRRCKRVATSRGESGR